MGPLASMEQKPKSWHEWPNCVARRNWWSAIRNASRSPAPDRERGAFVPPLLLLCKSPKAARAIHEVEAFGPVATVIPYRDIADAIALARRSAGSLVASVFSADDARGHDNWCWGLRRITAAS